MNEKGHEADFLGRGWAFPPSFVRGSHTVEMVSREEDIEQSLQILLSTTVGERFLQPTYGCNLHDTLFEGITGSILRFLEELVETAILFHEPRIKLERVTAGETSNEGLVLIEVHYLIRTTNTRTNYVYPFYLREGSDLKR